jgi:hypothetical protein
MLQLSLLNENETQSFPDLARAFIVENDNF